MEAASLKAFKLPLLPEKLQLYFLHGSFHCHDGSFHGGRGSFHGSLTSVHDKPNSVAERERISSNDCGRVVPSTSHLGVHIGVDQSNPFGVRCHIPWLADHRKGSFLRPLCLLKILNHPPHPQHVTLAALFFTTNTCCTSSLSFYDWCDYGPKIRSGGTSDDTYRILGNQIALRGDDVSGRKRRNLQNRNVCRIKDSV